MATIDADYAMGATEFEFVPMCGVLGLGHRAARDDKAYSKALIQLQTSAEDLRFRVRDTVPKALAKIGSVRGNTLISDVSSWTDGFFQGAAMLRALADPIWLTQISDATSVVNRLDETFRCLKDAPRSASRYPGYKALVEAISTTPGVVALRFGIPIFDTLVVWSNTKEPLLREAIEANLVDSRLGGRHSVELERVRASLIASAPQRRDPTTFVGPTRNRSKAQRRRA
jgi:hypothetical protein